MATTATNGGRSACRQWAASGSCKFGHSCRFLHARSGGGTAMAAACTTPSSQSSNSSTCRHWAASGSCKFGEQCRFLHGEVLAQKSPLHTHELTRRNKRFFCNACGAKGGSTWRCNAGCDFGLCELCFRSGGDSATPGGLTAATAAGGRDPEQSPAAALSLAFAGLSLPDAPSAPAAAPRRLLVLDVNGCVRPVEPAAAGGPRSQASHTAVVPVCAGCLSGARARARIRSRCTHAAPARTGAQAVLLNVRPPPRSLLSPLCRVPGHFAAAGREGKRFLHLLAAARQELRRLVCGAFRACRLEHCDGTQW